MTMRDTGIWQRGGGKQQKNAWWEGKERPSPINLPPANESCHFAHQPVTQPNPTIYRPFLSAPLPSAFIF